ncbi:hypothetical protein [Corynebacterium sp. MSK297]|nr:hypothetical protein [Corynebacterium sp. MSK297]
MLVVLLGIVLMRVVLILVASMRIVLMLVVLASSIFVRGFCWLYSA